MEEYKRIELSAAKYSQEGYELRQIVESGSWGMFRCYRDMDSGEQFYYCVDDDWGVGNIDDESLFSYRVEMQQEELRCLMAEF